MKELEILELKKELEILRKENLELRNELENIKYESKDPLDIYFK